MLAGHLYLEARRLYREGGPTATNGQGGHNKLATTSVAPQTNGACDKLGVTIRAMVQVGTKI